jgi:hypothetical protein
LSKRQGGRCHSRVPAEAAASLAEPLELSNWASPTSQKEKDEVCDNRRADQNIGPQRKDEAERDKRGGFRRISPMNI